MYFRYAWSCFMITWIRFKVGNRYIWMWYWKVIWHKCAGFEIVGSASQRGILHTRDELKSKRYIVTRNYLSSRWAQVRESRRNEKFCVVATSYVTLWHGEIYSHNLISWAFTLLSRIKFWLFRKLSKDRFKLSSARKSYF